MSSWLKVDPKVMREIRRDQGKLTEEGGVTVELTISPYDLPHHVRGEYDKSKNRFVIEFQYIQEEPYTLQASGDSVDVRVGKNSNRVYGFEIDTDALKADEVVLRVRARERVNKALEDFVEASRPSRRPRDNYQAVKSILQKKPDIFTPLEYETAS
jgi:hypothetical protein